MPTWRSLAAFALLGLTACSGSGRVHPGPPPPTGARVAVLPFTGPTSVVSYDDATADMGRQLAARIVEELRARGHAAELAADDAAIPDATVVRGRILKVDGGSHAKRFWLGFGAGRTSFAAEGTVTRPDGAPLGTFRERRSASGEAQLGFARDAMLVRRCLNALGSDIAEMIASGKYREAAWTG